MTAHRPYNEILGHPHDFLVEYRFLTADEGGRQTGAPYQGIRYDFWYEHDNHEMLGVFMIWPEFLNDKGEVITETDKKVPMTGTAKMWIINDKRRGYHQKRIKIGTKGYFMEGTRRTANCVVKEIAGLMTNPSEYTTTIKSIKRPFTIIFLLFIDICFVAGLFAPNTGRGGPLVFIIAPFFILGIAAILILQFWGKLEITITSDTLVFRKMIFNLSYKTDTYLLKDISDLHKLNDVKENSYWNMGFRIYDETPLVITFRYNGTLVQHGLTYNWTNIDDTINEIKRRTKINYA